MAGTQALAAIESFLRDLTLAWRNLATYPKGHPALTGSVDRAHASLRPILAVTGELRFGVVGGKLAWSDATLESIPAQRLSEALHKREIAVLTFREGLSPAELDRFLHLMLVDPRQAALARLDEELVASGISSIHVEPVDYSALRVAELDEELAPEERRTESLEERIIRELLEGRRLAEDESEGEDLDQRAARGDMGRLVERLLAALAAAERAAASAAGGAEGVEGAAARRAALAAVLARLVKETLSDRSDPRRGESVSQLAALLRALPADLRGPVLDAAIAALAGLDGDVDALRQLAASLSPTEVLKSFRRLAEQKFRFSPLAVRIAQALAAAAQEEARKRQRPADAGAITAALRSLFGDEDIDRFGAGGEQAASSPVLPKVVQPESEPPELGELRESLEPEAIDRQLITTLLELLESPLARSEGLEPLLSQLQRLFREELGNGRIRPAQEILERLQSLADSGGLDDEARGAIRRCLERLAGRESVLSLMSGLSGLGEAELVLARALMVHLGGSAIRHMLAALVEESDRSRRRLLLEFVCSLGDTVAPEATALLSDSRWFVVRNALVILHRIGNRSCLPAVRRCADHPDLRVRLEAIRVLFAFDPDASRQLLDKALGDPDPKLAESAITLVARRGFGDAVDPLVALIQPWDPFARRRSLRLRAWWALGQIGEPRALATLRRFFAPGWIKLDSLEERRAAFQSLAGYEVDDRAAWVTLGLKSRDSQIRAACQRLAASQSVQRAAGQEAADD